MDRDYKFFRRPLTMKVAKEIILERLQLGDVLNNSEITAIVVEHHEKLGGLPQKPHWQIYHVMLSTVRWGI